MPPKWKMRRRSIWPSTSLCGERKREEVELSRNLSQFKTLLFPQETVWLFDKIANIILWNHKIANAHERMALKDHLFWSKFYSVFESKCHMPPNGDVSCVWAPQGQSACRIRMLLYAELSCSFSCKEKHPLLLIKSMFCFPEAHPRNEGCW